MDCFQTFEDWLVENRFENHSGKALYEKTTEVFHNSELKRLYQNFNGYVDHDRMVYSRMIYPVEVIADDDESFQAYLDGGIGNPVALSNYLRAGYSFQEYLADPKEYEIRTLERAKAAGVAPSVLEGEPLIHLAENDDDIKIILDNLEILKNSNIKMRGYVLKCLRNGCTARELAGLTQDEVLRIADHFCGSVMQTFLIESVKTSVFRYGRFVLLNKAKAEFVAVLVGNSERMFEEITSVDAFKVLECLTGYARVEAQTVGNTLVFSAGRVSNAEIPLVYHFKFECSVEETNDIFQRNKIAASNLEQSTKMALVSMAQRDPLWLAVGLLDKKIVANSLKYYSLVRAANAVLASCTTIKIKDVFKPMIQIDGKEYNVFALAVTGQLTKLIRGTATWRIENEILEISN